MIHFAKHGIRRIEPGLGEPFGPNQHQAMFEIEDRGRQPGTIARIVLPGYLYHERLLRPVFVGVAGQNSGRAVGGDPHSMRSS